MTFDKNTFEQEAMSVLSKVERCSLGVVAVKFSWDQSEHSHCHFRTSNGWNFWVFNDAGEWDYFDRIEAPDGRTVDFDEIAGDWPKTEPAMPLLFEYESYASSWMDAKVVSS